MKNNYSKLDTIKDLVARGMSFAVAIALAGTMTACDPTNLPDDELPSDTPGVSDTVAPDSSETTTPDSSETTTPDSSETENEETITEPESSASEETLEPPSPELQAKYPAITDEEYEDLISYFSEDFEGTYDDGISKILFVVSRTGKITLTLEHNNYENYPAYRTMRIEAETLSKVLEIAAKEIIKENPTNFGYPENTTIYTLHLNNKLIHQDKINSILKLLHDSELKQQPTLE